jgi:hypothetical protein
VGRCGVVVGRCGSLWIVVGRCGSFHVLVTTNSLDNNTRAIEDIKRFKLVIKNLLS